jgi:hypothetical protein
MRTNVLKNFKEFLRQIKGVKEIEQRNKYYKEIIETFKNNKNSENVLELLKTAESKLKFLKTITPKLIKKVNVNKYVTTYSFKNGEVKEIEDHHSNPQMKAMSNWREGIFVL